MATRVGLLGFYGSWPDQNLYVTGIPSAFLSIALPGSTLENGKIVVKARVSVRCRLTGEARVLFLAPCRWRCCTIRLMLSMGFEYFYACAEVGVLFAFIIQRLVQRSIFRSHFY